MKNVNWALLLFVGALTVLLFGALAILKAKFFVLILPILMIGFIGYMLYTLIIALGYGDNKIIEEEKNVQENDGREC
jgi:choline-glycine betaine transporter